jgi:hypothetical protein
MVPVEKRVLKRIFGPGEYCIVRGFKIYNLSQVLLQW